MPKTMDSLTGDASPTNRLRLSPFRNSLSRESPTMTIVPHRGSLYRLEGDPRTTIYIIEMLLEKGQIHELHFGREDFEFFSRLFSILDTESRGLVGRTAVKDFVTLRCPVFWRRDDDLRKSHDLLSCPSPGYGGSPTFDEVWKAVATCSKTPKLRKLNENLDHVEIGVEGWMVFCRFIALAQYLEAKRRFSARHLQQTMRHRNAPNSELVVVDVPPPEAPTPITPQKLADYERRNNSMLPLPELDLDHSLLAAHDVIRRRHFNLHQCQGTVKISLFGSSFSSSLISSGSSSGSLSNLEFAVTYTAGSGRLGSKGEQLVVRRSFADMMWLNETFASHKVLGGTLCGRILPPFPKSTGNMNSSQFPTDESLLQSSIRGTGGAIAAAAASVGMIRDVAISFWGNYVAPPSPEVVVPPTPTSGYKFSKKPPPLNFALSESYYNPNSPSGIARQLERFLNYLLEHPALSASFPLNTILKASQSGLEAAKQSLKEHARVSKELEKQTPHMEDGKMSIPFWPIGSGGSSGPPPNLSWVRTAAQAAMALKVHGLLETTGLPSASARLQHASLPNFDNASSRNMAWADDDESPVILRELEHPELALINFLPAVEPEDTESFEQGVVQVESQLATEFLQEEGDGYDMLPLPVPAPERRILTVGNHDGRSRDGVFSGWPSDDSRRQARFHYGTTSSQTRKSRRDGEGFEEGYLGDISVDENIDKLREVIGSVDNVLSRCLVSSAGIGAARRERYVLSLDIMKGLDSWEGLRGKIIAQRALMKGVSGLEQSKDVYEESDLALLDDISWQNSLASCAVSAAEDVRSAVRAARTACSAKAAADSAAFAAQTVCDTGKFGTIEEARAAQTRASIAQSHAIHAAVVEHEAKTVKRRATLALAHDVKCWNVHRKREVLLACMSYARSQHEATRRAVDAWTCLRDGYLGSPIIPAQSRRVATPTKPPHLNPPVPVKPSMTDSDEVTTTIYEDITTSSNFTNFQPSIVAVDHEILAKITVEEEPPPKVAEKPSKPSLMVMPESLLPLVTASPILEEDEDLGGSQDDKVMLQKPDEPVEKEILSASMQSLVNGLMNWGEQYDSEDDYALPAGMAASIVLEGSGAFKVPN